MPDARFNSGLNEDEVVEDSEAAEAAEAVAARPRKLMGGVRGKLTMALMVAAGAVGLADKSADAQEGDQLAANNRKPVATQRGEWVRGTNGSTARFSLTRRNTGANTAAALPEVNQDLVDDMKKMWVGTVKNADRPGYERQMAALMRAYQEGDQEEWEALTSRTRNKARDFEPERLAFTGGPMHFISGVDGFTTNTGARIRCFFPVDKDGKRVGTKLHFIVTGLEQLNGENVTAIVDSGTGDLPTEDDVKGAMVYLARKYSLPEERVSAATKPTTGDVARK